MKIYSSRLSDLQERRSNLEQEISDNNAQRDREVKQLEEVEKAQVAPAKEAAANIFKKYPRLDAEITAEYSFSKYIILNIQVDQKDLHNPNSALSWSYKLKIDSDTGDLIRESGSWSGLDATTPESLESLQQTLEALQDIYNTDWKSVLLVERPNYNEYVKTKHRNFNEESSTLDREIDEAEIEEAIGKNIAFKVGNFPGSDYSYNSPYAMPYYHWVVFDRETPSQYAITEYSTRDGDSGKFEHGSSHRVKKSNVLNALIHPLESKQI